MSDDLFDDKSWLQFNMNSYLKVKLTDFGKDIHREQHELLASKFKGFPEYSPPEEDSLGYSSWQMWSFLSTFGEHIRLGGEMVCSIDVQFEHKIPKQIRLMEKLIQSLEEEVTCVYEKRWDSRPLLHAKQYIDLKNGIDEIKQDLNYHGIGLTDRVKELLNND